MKEVYSFPPKKYESMPGVFKTQYFNVELTSYLKVKSIELIKNISGMERELQLSFLRAFLTMKAQCILLGIDVL